MTELIKSIRTLIELHVFYIRGAIKVKILEVVDWSQVSNQPSQLESAAATRISCS